MSKSALSPRRARLPHLTFFVQWLRNPRAMASVIPSGRQLVSLMIAAMPESARKIIELGAGTGVITEALIRHGIDPQELLVVELNEVLHRDLKQRFSHTQIACSDARYLRELVDRSETLSHSCVDVVLSSLGLLAMSTDLQREILHAAFCVLRPGGVFIQYTYARRSPVSVEVCNQLGLICEQKGYAWKNFPPARVFAYYRRSDAAGDTSEVETELKRA